MPICVFCSHSCIFFKETVIGGILAGDSFRALRMTCVKKKNDDDDDDDDE